jgi:hypothetical protein
VRGTSSWTFVKTKAKLQMTLSERRNEGLRMICSKKSACHVTFRGQSPSVPPWSHAASRFRPAAGIILLWTGQNSMMPSILARTVGGYLFLLCSLPQMGRFTNPQVDAGGAVLQDRSSCLTRSGVVATPPVAHTASIAWYAKNKRYWSIHHGWQEAEPFRTSGNRFGQPLVNESTARRVRLCDTIG